MKGEVTRDGAIVRSEKGVPAYSHERAIALLLSTDAFEEFFGGVLGLSWTQYLEEYRNDFSWMYMRALREQGWRGLIYVPARHAKGRWSTEDGFEVRFLPLAKWYAVVRLLRFARAAKVGRYLSQLAAAAAFYGSLSRALSRDRVAALLVQEYWTARFDVLALNVRIPVIGCDMAGRSERHLKLVKRWSFKRACAVTTQTREEAAVASSFGARAVVRPNGVDTDIFKPVAGSVPPPTSILTVARLTDKQKRTSDLIRALALLPSGWVLQIAGVGPDEAALRRLASETGVLNRVHFLGFVSNPSDLCSLYTGCGVFALPSAHEGVCLALLEAMSCGAAVVASRLPAFVDLIYEDRNGITVPVGDISALSKALQYARSEHKRLGRAARETVEDRFSEASVGRTLCELVEACTGASAAGVSPTAVA